MNVFTGAFLTKTKKRKIDRLRNGSTESQNGLIVKNESVRMKWLVSTLLSIFVVFPTGKTINDFNEKWLRFRPGGLFKDVPLGDRDSARRS